MQPKAEFTIGVKDKTKDAFRSIKKGFGNVISSAFSLKTAMIGVAGIGGMGLLVKASLDQIDTMGKLSKTYGIATEELAAFQLAAEIGGSSLETFAKAARQVSKNVFDFVIRDTGEAKDAFQQLGISIDDLKPIMNDNVALIGVIGDELNNLEDGSIKTALAYKLLGGRAIELLPALEGGTEALKKYRIEAETFGTALSGKAVKGVENANDSMTRLGFLFKGLRDQTVAALAPALQMVVDTFKDFAIESFNAQGGVEKFAQNVAIKILETVQITIDALSRLGDFSSRFLSLFGESFAPETLGVTELNRQLEGIEQNITHIFDKMAEAGDRSTPFSLFTKDDYKLQLAGLIQQRDEILSELVTRSDESAGKGLNDHINDMIARIKEGSKGNDGYSSSLAKVGNNIGNVGGEQKKLNDLITEGKRITESVKTPVEKYNDELQRLNILLENNAINQETYNRAIIKSQDGLDNATGQTKELNDISKEFGLTMSSAFEGAVIGGEKLRDVVAGLGKDIQQMVLRQTVTKPLGNYISGAVGGFMNGVGSSFVSSAASAIGSYFGGFFADGGSPPVGKASMVGEQGPELFVPRSSGTIIPNNQLGGKKVVSNFYYIDARGADNVETKIEEVLFRHIPGIQQGAINGAIEKAYDMVRRGEASFT